ncbi:hypothetical protein L3Y34_010759 [Caenorhabditis briggsae]|uniref:Uncharacterized protein n=1 Tax=Caenorhabditis briggsae TaxID=6238 RepID=A0AAE8ZPG2_CAEBR|nr:hypothetical protein L3Y34_010759 [Caenorhabditis briggsae]
MLIVILVGGTLLFCIYYPRVSEVSRFKAIDWLDEKLTGESAPFENSTVIDDFHILAVYAAMHFKDRLSHPLLLKLLILLCVILWTVGNIIFVYFMCICKEKRPKRPYDTPLYRSTEYDDPWTSYPVVPTLGLDYEIPEAAPRNRNTEVSIAFDESKSGIPANHEFTYLKMNHWAKAKDTVIPIEEEEEQDYQSIHSHQTVTVGPSTSIADHQDPQNYGRIMKRSVLLLLAIIIFLISCSFGGWLVYEDTFDPISNSNYVFDYQWIDKHRLAIQYSSDEERAKYTTFQIYKLVFTTSTSIGNMKNVYNGSQSCASTADQTDSSGILDGPPTSIAAANKSLIYE